MAGIVSAITQAIKTAPTWVKVGGAALGAGGLGFLGGNLSGADAGDANAGDKSAQTNTSQQPYSIISTTTTTSNDNRVMYYDYSTNEQNMVIQDSPFASIDGSAFRSGGGVTSSPYSGVGVNPQASTGATSTSQPTQTTTQDTSTGAGSGLSGLLPVAAVAALAVAGGYLLLGGDK